MVTTPVCVCVCERDKDETTIPRVIVVFCSHAGLTFLVPGIGNHYGYSECINPGVHACSACIPLQTVATYTILLCILVSLY